MNSTSQKISTKCIDLYSLNYAKWSTLLTSTEKNKFIKVKVYIKNIIKRKSRAAAFWKKILFLMIMYIFKKNRKYVYIEKKIDPPEKNNLYLLEESLNPPLTVLVNFVKKELCKWKS
jgi:hypothetical protein